VYATSITIVAVDGRSCGCVWLIHHTTYAFLLLSSISQD